MMNAKHVLMLGIGALPLWAGEPAALAGAGDEVTVITPESVVKPPEVETPRIWVDANVGTLGAGVGISVNLSPSVRMRLRGAMLSYEQNERWSDMDSQLKIDADNVGLLFDYFPGDEKNFYLSAGLNFGENRMRCQATAEREPGGAKNINFGGIEYRLLNDDRGSISGKYAWNHVAPYIGIGYQDALWEGSCFYYSVDLGISFIGNGKLSVSSTGHWQSKNPATNVWSDATAADFHQSIRREGRDFFKIADDLCVYPVLQFSIGARF